MIFAKRWAGVLVVLGGALGAMAVRANTPPPIGPVYSTVDGLRQFWIYDSRGNKNLLIVYLPTNALTQNSVPMADRVVAYSNDVAVTATSVNRFHVTGLADASLNALIDLPVPSGTTGSDASLARVLFVSPTLLHLTTRNGTTYYYDTAQRRFRSAPAAEDALAVDPAVTLSTLNVSSWPRRLPVLTVAPDPSAARVSDGNPVVFDFNTNWGGWAGMGLDSDDYGTPALETVDLSSWNQLVVGLKGAVPRVKLEMVDDQDRKHFFYPRGLSAAEEKVWVLPLETARRVVNLARLRFVFLIVETPAAVGRLTLRREPTVPDEWAPTLLSPDQIQAPGRTPGVVRFAPNGDASRETATPRGLLLDFRTGGGWVTGTFNFDDFSTPSLETINLSTHAALSVGLRGFAREGTGSWADLGRVKLEVEDAQFRKFITQLTGVTADRERVWSLPMGVLGAAINTSAVRFITLVVEGSPNRNGLLRANLVPGREEFPNPLLAPAQLGGFPGAAFITRVAPEGNATSVTKTTRGLLLQYRTGIEGWAGGGFSFDDFGTPFIEIRDLSAVDALRFGVQGDVERVKLELVDNVDRKHTTFLDGISPGEEKVWTVPLSNRVQGMDRRFTRLIYFIVEGTGRSGSLRVNVVAPGASAGALRVVAPASTESAPPATEGWGRVSVFPNPAVGVEPTFRVECAGVDAVRLMILSVTGRVVAEAIMTPAGTVGGRTVFEHRWSGTDAASGVYVYRLTAQGGPAALPPKTGRFALVR
ncbi:MAG: hypothetical protein IPN65_01255 [Elusimicrobia bacterium]|nr:hypothetical protein [Elusimicrobiota bacterium]